MVSGYDKKEERRRAILNDPILPLLVKTSIPTIIGMLVMVIYNLTDTFFVGILNRYSIQFYELYPGYRILVWLW